MQNSGILLVFHTLIFGQKYLALKLTELLRLWRYSYADVYNSKAQHAGKRMADIRLIQQADSLYSSVL